jgi:hypothetical protein
MIIVLNEQFLGQSMARPVWLLSAKNNHIFDWLKQKRAQTHGSSPTGKH